MPVLLDEVGPEPRVSRLYPHDLSAAHYLGGDMMVMKRGEVVETGNVYDVLHNPQHAYTKLLLESIPNPDPDHRWETSDADLSDLEQAAGVSQV